MEGKRHKRIWELFVACALVALCSGAIEASTPYAVQPHDTLASISRKAKVPIDAIRHINPSLDATGKIRPGQQIMLPDPEPPGYTVRKGETLNKIARDHGISVQTLRSLNPRLAKDGGIRAGQTLQVPTEAVAAVQPALPANPPIAASPSPEATPPAPTDELTYVDATVILRPEARNQPPVTPTPVAPKHDGMPNVLALAKTFLGIPYVWGGTTVRGFDCSGYVQYVFRRNGIPILRTADCQYYQGKPVQSPEPGDLVFFSTYLPGPSHVGIYLGNNQFIHASSRHKSIVISSLGEPYFRKAYIGARRYR